MRTLCFLVICTFILNSTPAMSQNGNYVEANGARIFYQSVGQGEPLVLLHGFTVSHVVWMPFVAQFADSYRVIIPDLRGHGHSTNPGGTFTHEQGALDIFALLDALDINSFKAVGHSSGGMILTHMALMQPERINSMIMIGSTSFFPEECRAIQRGTTYETADPGMLGFLNSVHPGGEEQIRDIFTMFRAMSEDYEDMNFTAEQLTGIQTETLIVHGDRDMFFPVDIPVLSYKSIPNSYLWIIPNDGHVPAGLSGGQSLWTSTFTAVANDFLAGNWSKE